MILLIGILIIGFILGYTYLEMGRQEIQIYQEALQRENEKLQAKIKSEQEKMKVESIKNIGSVEV